MSEKIEKTVYRLERWGSRYEIHRVPVISETPKQYVIPDRGFGFGGRGKRDPGTRRVSKAGTRGESYFESFDAAVNAGKTAAKAKIDSAKASMDLATEMLSKLNEITSEEEYYKNDDS